MSSGVAKHAVGTAIRAKEKFLPKGTLTGERFNLLREIAIGTVLGVSAGMVWKTWHWNEKRRIATFYAELAKKEQEEEAAHTAELRAKLKTLEDELLA